MAAQTHIRATADHSVPGNPPPADPCIMVIFGASGDLTKRLLTPALFNLACDGLLPKKFAIVGMAMDKLSPDQFRSRMTDDIKKFTTRQKFDDRVWQDFVARLNYLPGDFSDPEAFKRLADTVDKLDAQYQTGGNVLFYMAIPPVVFGLVSSQLDKAVFKKREKGWIRLVVEK